MDSHSLEILGKLAIVQLTHSAALNNRNRLIISNASMGKSDREKIRRHRRPQSSSVAVLQAAINTPIMVSMPGFAGSTASPVHRYHPDFRGS
jgi:hypothetical protein